MASSSKDAEINRLLARAASRVKWLDFGRGFAVVGALLFLFLLVAAVADHAIGLHRTARLALAAFFYLCFPALCAIMVFRPLLKSVSPYYAARLIEQQYPEYKNTLISYVELAEKKRPSWLRRSIARRFKQERRPPNLDQAIRYRDFMLAAYGMAAMIVIFSVYCILSDKSVSRALARVLQPWRELAPPTLTVVTNVEPGDAKVPAGSVLEVTARIDGLFPPAIFLEWTGADGLSFSERMERVGDDPRRWRGRLRDVSDRLTYHVLAGDGRSRDFLVETFPPLALEDVTVRCKFPAYTRLEPVLLRERELSAVVGSKLFVECRFNNPLKKAEGLFGRSALPVRMNETTVTFESKLTRTADYFVSCIDVNDQQLVPKVLHVEAQKDRKPVLRVRNLPPVIEVPSWPETLAIDFEVSDDFGVARSRVEYRVDGVRGEPRIIPHPAFTRSFSGRYLLDLSSMHLRADSALAFRLTAFDAHEPEPNRAETEWFMVERVPGAKAAEIFAERGAPGRKTEEAEAVNDVEAERRRREALRELERLAKAEEHKIDQLKRALEKLRHEARKRRDRETAARETAPSGARDKTTSAETKAAREAADRYEQTPPQGAKKADPGRTARDGAPADGKRTPTQGTPRAVQKPTDGRKAETGGQKRSSEARGDEGRKAPPPKERETGRSKSAAGRKGPPAARDSRASPDARDAAAKSEGARAPESGKPRQETPLQGDRPRRPPAVPGAKGGEIPSSDKPSDTTMGRKAPGAARSGKTKETGTGAVPSPGSERDAGRASGRGVAQKAPGRGESKSAGERRPGEGYPRGSKTSAGKQAGAGSKKGEGKGASGAGSSGRAGNAQGKAGSGGKPGSSGGGKSAPSRRPSGAGGAPKAEPGGRSDAGDARPTGAGGRTTGGGGPAGSRDETRGDNLARDAASEAAGDETSPRDPWRGLPSTEKTKAYGKLVRRLREALSDPEKSKRLADELGWTPGELRRFVEKFERPVEQLEKARKKMARRLDEVDSREGEKAKALKGGGFDTSAAGATRQDFRKTPKDDVKRLAGDEGDVFSPEYREAVVNYFKRLAEEGSEKTR